MRMFLIMAVAVFALSGCLSKMEKITEETKASVDASNHLIEETHNSQTFGGAYTVVLDDRNDFGARTVSAETVMVLAKPDRIGAYLGAPTAKLSSPTAFRVLDKKMVEVPNVAYVGPKPAKPGVDHLGIVPRGTDLFEVYFAGAKEMAYKFYLASFGNPNDAEVADYKKKLVRVIDTATIVAGAMDVTHVVDVAKKTKPREFLITQSDRAQIAYWLTEAANKFDMSADVKNHLKVMINTRLGLPQ